MRTNIREILQNRTWGNKLALMDLKRSLFNFSRDPETVTMIIIFSGFALLAVFHQKNWDALPRDCFPTILEFKKIKG